MQRGRKGCDLKKYRHEHGYSQLGLVRDRKILLDGQENSQHYGEKNFTIFNLKLKSSDWVAKH